MQCILETVQAEVTDFELWPDESLNYSDRGLSLFPMGTSLLAITLSLLEKNADYDDLTTACKPIWKAINAVTESSNKRLAEYAEWIGEAEKMQSTGKDLNEVEEIYVDRVDSFLHDESFIFHTSRGGLAWSLILVVSKLMSKDFQLAADTLNKLSPTFGKLKWKQKVVEIYSLGPKVANEPWAMCVRAASNYVRHSNEWRVKTVEKKTVNGKEELVKITDPLVNQLPTDQRPSAATIISIGISEEDLLTRSGDQSYKVCEILHLLDENALRDFFCDWNDALVNYMKKMNGN
ncbi:MAG: hypothetical protein AB7F59_15045 [Bdellovibrionales bacterium]